MEMKKLSMVLILLFSCSHLSCSTPTYFKAIFNFGDSLSDTGNFLLSGASGFPGIGHLPYGTTFFGHPTGRSCDGRLVIDFIAEALGLPLIPPFLGQNQSFVHGANFAVVGATALDTSFFKERGLGADGMFLTNYTWNLQLQWFEQLITSLCHTTQECREHFSKSLFVGGIGGNDYNFPLLAGRSFEQVKSYVPHVVETISNAIERLISHGAAYLVVPGSAPIGCCAMFLTMPSSSPIDDEYEADTGCLKGHNDIVRYHNILLLEAVKKLRRKYSRVKISYADFYEPIIQFARSPDSYGFQDKPLLACCGGDGPYNYDFNVGCGEVGSRMCRDPKSFMDWDGLHYSEAAYNKIATFWLNGPYADPPILDIREKYLFQSS